MANIDTAIDPTGHIKNIHKYKQGRKCIYCNKKLNSYNPDVYCFAHMSIGESKKRQNLREIDERKRLETNRKHKAKKNSNRNSSKQASTTNTLRKVAA